MKYNFKFKGPQESLIQCIGQKWWTCHQIAGISIEFVRFQTMGFFMGYAAFPCAGVATNDNCSITIAIQKEPSKSLRRTTALVGFTYLIYSPNTHG
jgi:hypothetical protein